MFCRPILFFQEVLFAGEKDLVRIKHLSCALQFIFKNPFKVSNISYGSFHGLNSVSFAIFKKSNINMANPAPNDAPPTGATDAVLMKSEEMPKDAQQVEELDFNKLKGPITAEDLFLGMRHMGFQASAMSEAVRIINDMVCITRFISFG